MLSSNLQTNVVVLVAKGINDDLLSFLFDFTLY